MPLDVKLVVVGGDVKTTELKLRLPSTIGRGRGTSIVLPHPLVSRQHCELFESDGQLIVRDLGSLNGTFVNNQRITESPLPSGELLTVGTVTFRAVYEAAAGSTDTLRTAPGDKTLPASKAPTVKAPPKSPPAAEPAHSDSEVLEFNFDQPLLPGDDDDDIAASPSHPTERLSEPLRPAARSKSAAPDDVTIRVEAQEEAAGDDDDDATSDSDDDLNDFLKNLK